MPSSKHVFLFLFLLIYQIGKASINPDSTYSIPALKELISKALVDKDFQTIAMAYSKLGDAYYKIDNKEDAFNAYKKSSQYFGVRDDSLNYHKVQTQLAKYYTNAQLYEDAIELYEGAANYFERTKNQVILPSLYKEFADIFHKKEDLFNEAIYLNKAIKANEKLEDKDLEIATYLAYVDVYSNMMKLDTAMRAAARLIEITSDEKDTLNLALGNLQMGRINLKREKFYAAIEFLSTGDTLLQQIDASALMLPYYVDLSSSFKAIGEYEKAHQSLEKHAQHQSLQLLADKKKGVDEIAVLYQRQQKEEEIEALRREKTEAEIERQRQSTIIYSFFVGVFVILLGVYFIIRFYQQQISAKEIITKQNQEINRQKIVELENNLKIETMQSMLAGQEAERERVAKDLHDSLGGLLSTIKLQFESVPTKAPTVNNLKEFQNASLMLDEACQEVRNISNNMQPGALVKLGLVPAVNDLINRFQDEHYPEIDFQHYGLDHQKLDNTIALMVFRIIQELLNNSIKHAKAQEIIIQLTAQEKELIIMVEDDGVGYAIDTVKKGMGTENIASRVNFLKGDLSVHSVKGHGTSTMINVPL